MDRSDSVSLAGQAARITNPVSLKEDLPEIGPSNGAFFIFGEEMNQHTTAAVASSGENSIQELFALSDEQIWTLRPKKK